MSKVPESKPFRQVPTWDSTEKFEIQGAELEALYNFFNIFAPAFTSIQQIFARGVQGGKIKIGYEYEDGTGVPADEVEAYTKRLNEYFQQKMKEETAQITPDEPTEHEAPKGKIVSFTGEAISTDA